MRADLQEMAEKLGILLSEKQLSQFEDYASLLLLRNRDMNLTAVTEYDDVVIKHFIDSLAAVRAYDFEAAGCSSLLDIGTGAGFPGIPLKIAFPALSVTLLDARQKRISFLDEVIGALGLQDIQAVHGRAEDFIHGQTQDLPVREAYDICVSRAVSNLAVLAEYCLPYVKIGGVFLAYKSSNVEEELDEAKGAISVLGGAPEEVCRFTLPDTDLQRSIVRIRKTRNTEEKYPRRAGKPEKEPLKF